MSRVLNIYRMTGSLAFTAFGHLIFHRSDYSSFAETLFSFVVTGKRTPDRKFRRAARKRLTDPPVNEGEDIKHGGHIWVVVSRGLLQVLQGLFAEGHGHLVPPLGGVLDHQVVEGSQTGRDLVAPLLGGSRRGAAVARLDWERRERIAVLVKHSHSLFLTGFKYVNKCKLGR